MKREIYPKATLETKRRFDSLHEQLGGCRTVQVLNMTFEIEMIDRLITAHQRVAVR